MTLNTLLIISTLICTLVNVVPIIMKYVITWIFSEENNEIKLRTKLLELEQEMSVISMVDEFSKYTKIQRKHAKLKEDHKKQISARISSRTKAQLFSTYSVKIFNAIIAMILLKLYKEQPIIILPKGILWPLNDVFSWPGIYQDSISLIIWVGVSTLVIPRLLRNELYAITST